MFQEKLHKFISSAYLWACQRLYSELAWGYDWVSWVVSMGQWSAWREIALNYLVGDTILEIGFGTGRLLGRLKSFGTNVFGLERSPALHTVAARTLASVSVEVPRVQAVAQSLPFADKSFDSIVATFPSAYILDPDTLIECVRVLRNRTHQPGRLVIIGLWVYLEHPVLRLVTPVFYQRPEERWLKEVRARMEEAGLRVELVEHKDGVARVGVLVAEVRQ